MKKSIIIALALAVPAMAGDEKSSPITVVDVPVAAPAACPFALEVAGTWITPLQDADDDFHDLKMWGVDVTGVYKLNDNWAVTLRGTWASGTDASRGSDAVDNWSQSWVDKADITNWTITAGMRYTAQLTQKLSWYAGANIGWGRTEMRYTTGWSWYDSLDHAGDSDGMKVEGDDVGVAYSVEMGLKYNITENLYATGSVGFRGMTTEPNFEFDRAGQQTGISVSAGLGWQF